MPRLTKDVQIDGTWYGPSHGNADLDEATAAKVDDPDAFGGQGASGGTDTGGTGGGGGGRSGVRGSR